MYIPLQTWDDARRKALGGSLLRSHGRGAFSHHDDAHACFFFYALFPLLKASTLGT
jgi:hypothetical protein